MQSWRWGDSSTQRTGSSPGASERGSSSRSALVDRRIGTGGRLASSFVGRVDHVHKVLLLRSTLGGRDDGVVALDQHERHRSGRCEATNTTGTEKHCEPAVRTRTIGLGVRQPGCLRWRSTALRPCLATGLPLSAGIATSCGTRAGRKE